MQNKPQNRLLEKYKNFVCDRYQPGVLVPWWKGYVKDSYMRHEVVVAPIGFNVVFGLIYDLYHLIRTYRIQARRFNQKQYELRHKQ